MDNQQFQNIIGHDNIKIAYNQSQGKVIDFVESALQKVGDDWGLKDLLGFVSEYIYENFMSLFFDYKIDINKQVTSYEESIKNGHGVVTVAHSQGNFFTNDAYGRLDSWMQEYFHIISVATPTSYVADPDAPIIIFDNDAIVRLPDNNHPVIINPNRESEENTLDDMIQFHMFEYYLGYIKTVNENNVSTNIAANAIKYAIISGMNSQIAANSQWKIESENMGTNVCKERRANLVHFQDAVAPIDAAYPFSTVTNSDDRQLGKVYQVTDANASKYVLASSGGTNIIDVEDQGVILDDAGNDVGCYQLSGTDDNIIKSCGDANTTDGVLEVDLSWKSPDINLTLTVLKDGSEVGTLDDVGNCPKEHRYIATEEDVEPGTYVVHVTTQDTASIDESLLPEVITLKVKAP
ncbi:MAG: hypothetical protein WBF77_03835, partial [Sulfurimonadaceae bacterium]